MIQLPIILFYLILALLVFLMAMSSYLVISYRKEVAAKDVLSNKYELLQEKMNLVKLENYEAKLNPHLFKNILNSIQSHAYQTYNALDSLASVLDYILYESRAQLVSPKDEIEFATHLIEINKIKLSPLFDLQVKHKLDKTSLVYNKSCLAPMISIDLIENAFKHTDFLHDHAFIKIQFSCDENNFVLTVSNRISSFALVKKEKGGFGIDSLNHRLKMIYGEDYSLKTRVDENTFVAQLTINLANYHA